MYWYYLRSVSF
ncbi:hypothetical protein Celaphus_00011903 [Cervus elaphus hippelaphus]|uniref:Uncharacterized protein n=1 Tax=Cervus elaphus hippelaphus TaxID=46360 RepID=A0A212CKS1_CEREH|nr:hypothetical protein Celaphus_00011903 [Cervus elaphus hippelaphus]